MGESNTRCISTLGVGGVQAIVRYGKVASCNAILLTLGVGGVQAIARYGKVASCNALLVRIRRWPFGKLLQQLRAKKEKQKQNKKARRATSEWHDVEKRDEKKKKA